MKRIYGYLKLRLKDLGITYVHLANEMGIEPSTLSKRINGQGDFRLSEWEKILEVIGETDPREICKLMNLDGRKIA